MKTYYYFLILINFSIGCSSPEKESSSIIPLNHNVGDINFDPLHDNSNFMLCDSTKVISGRSTMRYADQQHSYTDLVMNLYQFESRFESFNGYVMARFIMNCNKETGRYRVQSLGADFSIIECPEPLKQHILSIVKELDNWEYSRASTASKDCSKFINFKISNGKIEKVLQ